MSLTAGTRIGPYEIVAPIGVGGMGEVYRATDTHLARQAAIKVLPEAFALDADRVARFEREARTLASLNHPNIAQVFGLEKRDGGLALAMELVEGPTLADRLAHGALAIDETIPVARQIAEALEAAHDQGIVHRDLKPANIKVRADGTVKVLDFGLAKAGAIGADDRLQSATITSPVGMTQAGMLMGTAAYMSPEQAKGRAVDRRADIWAFGCVLYEMLTATRTFPGDDASDVFVAIIRDEPRWAALPADTPMFIRRLLNRCLQKDIQKRLPHIGVARLELAEGREPGTVGGAPEKRSSRIRPALIGGVIGMALVGAAAFGLRPNTSVVVRPETVRFEIAPPSDREFPAANGAPRFAVSPDGRAIVYQGSTSAGSIALWMRRLDSIATYALRGTDTGSATAIQYPFWSPDGRTLAFFDEPAQQLKKLDIEAGVVQTVCAVPGNQVAGTWNADGVILMASAATRGVWRVAAPGGPTTPVTTLDSSNQEIAHLWPDFLPDGRHFLYLSTGTTQSAVFVASLDGGVPKRLIQTMQMARFAAPDRVLYVRGDALVSQRFDLQRLELTGEPSVVANSIMRTTAGRVAVSASRSGVLVYAAAAATSSEAGGAVWLDRSGRTLEPAPIPGIATGLRLSADGRSLSFLRNPSGLSLELWLYDTVRQIPTRLTTITGQGVGNGIVFSPDGSRVVYRGDDVGAAATLVEQPISGATAPVVILKEANGMAPHDWSPDGKFVLYGTNRSGRRDLYRLPTSGDRVPIPYLVGGTNRYQSRISPDGRWVAYTSDEGGRPQVFVQSFPDPSGGKWPASRPGGSYAHWRQDGRELFFVEQGRLLSVPVTTSTRPEFGAPTTLFDLPALADTGRVGYPYDVAPDGQRFIVWRPAASARFQTLTVAVNWMP